MKFVCGAEAVSKVPWLFWHYWQLCKSVTSNLPTYLFFPGSLPFGRAAECSREQSYITSTYMPIIPELEIILGNICPSNGSLVPVKKWKKSPKSLHLPMPAVRLVYLKLWLPAMYWANAIIYFILVFWSMSTAVFVSLRSNGEPSHEFSLKTGVLSCKCLC